MATFTFFQGSRLYSGPMDASLVFSTKTEMENFKTNNTAYGGMIVGCLGDNKAYMLNSARTTWINISGTTGSAGKDGTSPTIGANGNWFVGTTDTGVKAQGPKGDDGDLTGVKLNGTLLTKSDGTVDIVLTVSNIPDLPASKITSGELGVPRIPNLDTSKITTGTFNIDRIPNLPASRITSETFNVARIPDLDASKIITGLLSVERIPNLDANKITSGTFGEPRIPNLPASKINTGTLDVGRIPNLDANKITTGVLDAGRIPLASSTRGGIKASAKGVDDTVEVKIGSDEKLYVPKYPEGDGGLPDNFIDVGVNGELGALMIKLYQSGLGEVFFHGFLDDEFVFGNFDNIGAGLSTSTFVYKNKVVFLEYDGNVPEITNEFIVDKNMQVKETVTITVANWESGTSVTKTVSGVTATNIIWVSPTPASRAKAVEFDVYASAQGTDTITFTANATPDAEITFNVVIGGN